MRKILFVFLFVLGGIFKISAADTTKVGLFVSDIYDLNSVTGTFSSEVRYWVLFKGETAKTSYTEFPHAKSVKFTGSSKETKDGYTWTQVHISAQFLHSWDMTNFPFDRQHLRIINESTLDTSKVIIVADTTNSQIKDDAMETTYKIIDYRIYDTIKVHSSNLGNPFGDNKQTCFSRVITEIDIERNGTWVIFFKIFAAVIISFYISTLVFFIKPEHFEARFSLPVGSLFAAVGSKFVVDSLLGITSTITLVDKVYIFTYIMIFFIAILSLISYKIYEKVDPETVVNIHNRKFDMITMITTCLLYLISLIVMVAYAANAY